MPPSSIPSMPRPDARELTLEAYQPASAAPARPAAADQAASARRFEFTGTGAEYFRIWVVNLLLTVATCGVYSAWAKVRRLQYFYRNTRLAGAIFDYHGDPKAILKGRVLALGLLLAYKIASDLSTAASLLIGAILVAALPWMLARSLRFKLINSSYRGLRFRFGGSVAGAYKNLSLVPVMLAVVGFFGWSVVTSFSKTPSLGLVLLLVGLLLLVLAVVPLAHFLLKRYQHDNAYFGQTPFFFHAGAKPFFILYGVAILFLVLGVSSAQAFDKLFAHAFQALGATSFGWLFKQIYTVLSAYALYLFARPYMESRLQNLVWNESELGMNRFDSRASARRLLWLHLSNLTLIMLTLGLYKPFATVSLLKYRIESVAVLSDGDLEQFLVDHAGDNAGALGQEAGDLFDLDIAL